MLSLVIFVCVQLLICHLFGSNHVLVSLRPSAEDCLRAPVQIQFLISQNLMAESRNEEGARLKASEHNCDDRSFESKSESSTSSEDRSPRPEHARSHDMRDAAAASSLSQGQARTTKRPLLRQTSGALPKDIPGKKKAQEAGHLKQ